MDETVAAQKILDVLSNHRTSFATLRELAQKAGFKTAHNKSFKEGLKLLIRKDIVELCQSGWSSEKRGNQHPKGVVLLSDIYRLEDAFTLEGEQARKKSLNPSEWSASERETHLVGLEKLPRLSKLVTTAIDSYFALCLKHSFSEAIKTLETIKDSLPRKPFFHGFYIGLNSIVVSFRERDTRTFANNIDKSQIDKHLKDFRKRLDSLHPSYDQGYFFAMIKYLTFLKKERELKRRYRL